MPVHSCTVCTVCPARRLSCMLGTLQGGVTTMPTSVLCKHPVHVELGPGLRVVLGQAPVVRQVVVQRQPPAHVHPPRHVLPVLRSEHTLSSAASGCLCSPCNAHQVLLFANTHSNARTARVLRCWTACHVTIQCHDRQPVHLLLDELVDVRHHGRHQGARKYLRRDPAGLLTLRDRQLQQGGREPAAMQSLTPCWAYQTCGRARAQCGHGKTREHLQGVSAVDDPLQLLAVDV